MEIIKDGEALISIIFREKDWVKGLNFITPDEIFVQVGAWWYDKGKKLDRHIHNEFDRNATRTQECVYVIDGAMKIIVYSETQELLKTAILEKGDLAVFVAGGHGYEILDDDTRILESKNGPFLGVEIDKTKF